MPKLNEFALEGTVEEISEPQFLQDGAEVQTIVLWWMDGTYRKQAAVGFYAKGSGGLDKLHKLEIKVGDTVSIPFQPHSEIREGEGKKGPYRFWDAKLRGDSWRVTVLERNTAAAEAIPFPD